MTDKSKRAGRGKSAYLCGTPEPHCHGKFADVSNGLRSKIKHFHGSREESLKCYKSYLVSQGYTAVGLQAMRQPDGGPVLVLGRPSQFGLRLRPGKGSRSMPPLRSGGAAI